MFGTLLTVQVPDSQIQICGKQQPVEIGELQFPSQGTYGGKLPDHRDNKCDEQDDPEKCKQSPLKCEKENGP